MARTINRLTAVQVTNAKAKGLYPDGGGLHLKVTATGSKSWILRFRRNGQLRDMGLGPVPEISLARARELAGQAKQQRAGGIDPIVAREEERAAAKRKAARGTTFRSAAEQFIASHEASWRNARHRQQWPNTLRDYAYPVLADVAVSVIDTTLVLKVLEPMWATKTETANRVRQRIEIVLDWAKARGMRDGENAARWRGHLDHILPSRSKLQAVKHHAALPYTEVAAFIADLRVEKNSLAALALEFIVLTAVRCGDALGARWEEFDLGNATWIIPAARTKRLREHRVPLSKRAVEIVRHLREARISEHVFPGRWPGRPLSDSSTRDLILKLRSGITTHGFRSAFKDWSAEQTTFPDHVSAAALAHASADSVRAAYDLFDRRRELMDAWAAYCTHARADVINMKRRGRQPK